MSDRGVSDIIGFVLTFSLIVMMIGVVYTVGMGELQTSRTAEKIENAERAFEVLDSNVADLSHRGAPSRATSIRLSNSRMRFGDPVTFELTFTGTDSDQTYRATVDPIVYDSNDGTSIVYANGAVIRDQRSGDVMVNEPPFVFADHTIVPFIRTRGGSESVGGQTTALVRTSLSSRQLFVRKPSVSGDVELTITSPRADVWATYVEEESDGTCTVSGDEATCTLSPSHVAVPLAKIDVELA